MTSESPHRTRRMWLIALVAFAAFVRLIGIDWDDRHFFHPDERAIAFAIERLSFSPLQLDPDFFAYGSFPFYVNRALSSVLGLFDPSWGRYAQIIHNGRALSGFLGILTVLLTYLLGTRLYGWHTGILAGFLLAACPLHIQNSHYITTDVFLTFIVLATLFFAVQLSQRGWTRDYLYTGIGIGFAVATKFSALPLLAPFGVACLVRIAVERRFFAVVGKALLALLAVGSAFFIGQPYAFLNWTRYSHDIEEQSRMVRNAGMFPYTNQYVGTPKYFYELEQMILWGMAPALGLTAVIGAGARILNMMRERSSADLVLLAYVVPFFLVTGWFDVKFPRYLLPIYPILIIWAAVLLARAAERSLIGRIAKWTVVGLTGLAAMALMSIYFRPFTQVTASEWTYRHIPAGSTILSQHWDEGFPMPLPGPGRNGQRYNVKQLPYYEPDNSAKIRQLSEELAGGDYIAFQTKRLYGALTQASAKFPLSNNYFYLLFAGDLGYELVYSHASRPSLFGFEFPDELADESLTVYDHPKVLIFKNTENLDADEIFRRVMRGIPSQKLTRSDLLLAEASAGGFQASGATVEPVRSSLAALIWFAAVVQIAGLCMFALLRHALPVAGVYALSKVFGVLLLTYLPWAATLLGTGFTREAMMVSFAALVVAGLLGWRRAPAAAVSRADFIATEGLFWFAFALFLLVRAWNPEIYWGEKPMDFAFLNALTRSSDIPPPEPWFSGSTLHYTYFGHYIVAAIGKLCHIHPGITFNLGIGLFAALTAVAAYAAGSAATRRWQGGLLAAFFVILTGNLSGLREWIGRTPPLREPDASALDQISWLVSNAPRTLNFDYFWATSRVIKDTINEYPLWSFIFADLHAHALVMPFSLSFIALTLWWARRSEEPVAPSALTLFGLLAFTLGAIMVTNGWSTPTYVLFLPFLLGTVGFATRGVSRLQWGIVVALGFLVLLPAATLHLTQPPVVAEFLQWTGWRANEVYSGAAAVAVAAIAFTLIPGPLLLTGATGALAYLLYLPFWRHFTSPVRNWGWENDAFANAYDYLNIFGLFLFVAAPFLYLLWRLRMDPPRGARVGWLRGTAMVLFVAAVAACFALSMPEMQKLVPQVRTLGGTLRFGLAALALLAFYCAIERCLTTNLRIAAALFAFAFAITTGADVVHVWDRMNTIFKFYIESWFMFSIASAAALTEIWRRTQRSGWLHRSWRVGMVFIVLLSVFTGATAIRGVIVTRRVQTPRPTLDGTAYLKQRDAHELAAYEWINDNVPGIPVIAEAHGPSYQDYTRVSMNTGLPTVLGWDYHVHQRAHRWPDIRRRKADLEKLYTSDNKEVVKGILGRYNVALVYVGGVERRTHAGGNTANFKEWDDLLTTVYTNRGVHVFAVNGQFSGAMPVTTIEEVPQVADGEEMPIQGREGVLKQPRGMAVDSHGNIYVADFGNDRIQVFDSSMQFIRTWGQRGQLPGEFNQPSGVAVGSDGNVYVADTWNQRIQVFKPDGEYLREWGGSFYGPRGIGAGPTGEIYLSDTGNHKLKKFDLEGKELAVWAQRGDAPGELNEPVGVAVDGEGRVYVADNGNARVQVFSPDGKLETSFAVPGLELKVYSEPGIAVTSERNVWITVPTQRALRCYDINGNLLEEHIGKDEGGTFSRPMGVAIDPTTQDVVLTDLESKVLRLAAPTTADTTAE